MTNPVIAAPSVKSETVKDSGGEDCRIPVWSKKEGRYLEAQVSPIDHARVSRYKWRLDRDGYPRATIAKKGQSRVVLLSRFVLDAPPNCPVYYRTTDKLDCRREMLQLTPDYGRRQNRRRAGRSGYRGVTVHHRKDGTIRYAAWIEYGGRGAKPISLGIFASPEAAARAYDRKARKVWGSLAALNFPKPTDAQLPPGELFRQAQRPTARRRQMTVPQPPEATIPESS